MVSGVDFGSPIWAMLCAMIKEDWNNLNVIDMKGGIGSDCVSLTI